MSFWITQTEADTLLSMEKHRVLEDMISLPDFGGRLDVPLVSEDRTEEFHLDISRNRINLSKGTFQNRARKAIILARLDFGGAPHRNPDDTEISSPHLHLYREGFADKWAFPVPAEQFQNLSDFWQTLYDFMSFCNVTQPPNFSRGIFT